MLQIGESADMARTTTKRPAPKSRLADPRNEALARMTKAELVKTVKKLDAKQTQLLNRIAKLECGPTNTDYIVAAKPDSRVGPNPFAIGPGMPPRFPGA
jgi:hypothetical protein